MQIKCHIYWKYGSRRKEAGQVESVYIKGVFGNDRTCSTPALSLSWLRCQTEKAGGGLFQMWSEQDTHLMDWFLTSAHPTLISILISFSSRVPQLTSSRSHVSAAHAPTHLCSCSFICPAFCVGFIRVSVYLHAPRLGLKRSLSHAWQFPHSVDTFLIRSIKETFHANPVRH